MKSRGYAAIVGFFVLLAGCANVMDSGSGAASIPRGKGRLAISLENARTALPSGTFDKYKLHFDYDGEEEYNHAVVEWATGSLTVDLEPGNWTIRADAYVGDILSGTGSETETIVAGTVTPVTILLGINSGEGIKGTLIFKASYPSEDENHGYGTQKLVVTNPDGETVAQHDISNGIEGPLELPAGIYYAQVNIENTIQGTGVIRTGVAHIYGGRDSRLEFDITAEEFSVLVPLTVTAKLLVPDGMEVESWKVTVTVGDDIGLDKEDLIYPPGEEGEEFTHWIPFGNLQPDMSVRLKQKITVDSVEYESTADGTIENPNRPVGFSLTDAYFKVNIPAISGGTVKTAAGKPIALQGANVELMVTPGGGLDLKAESLKVNDGNVALSESGPNYTFIMPDSDVTISAKFIRHLPISIEVLDEAEAIGVSVAHSRTGTVSSDAPLEISWIAGETLTFTLDSEGYSAEDNTLRWLMNGEDQVANGNSLTIEARDHLVRAYTLTVMIKKNDQWYSKDIGFIVTK
jgi:hypothetical protein